MGGRILTIKYFRKQLVCLVFVDGFEQKFLVNGANLASLMAKLHNTCHDPSMETKRSGRALGRKMIAQNSGVFAFCSSFCVIALQF